MKSKTENGTSDKDLRQKYQSNSSVLQRKTYAPTNQEIRNFEIRKTNTLSPGNLQFKRHNYINYTHFLRKFP